MSDLERGGRRRRWPWLAAFTAVLAVSISVPGFASEPPALPPDQVPLAPRSLEADEPWIPDAERVGEGLAAAAREKAERERELANPELVREREESRNAFAGVDAAGAEGLLREEFGDQLASLNLDPARYLSRADVVRGLDGTTAGVKKDGEGLLLDAGIPIKTEDETGKLRAVDLSLEATPVGLQTANALQDVRIGGSAANPVEVGEGGFSISQPDARSGAATRSFGTQNAFQFETYTDTDTLISPTAHGVEIFNLLRSEDSPEAFRFEVALPEGAELRSNGANGAIVERAGKTVAAIPFPTAVDAQGTDVPVSLTVEGSALVVGVDHRGGDYAMPILLDPYFELYEDWANWNWYSGHSLEALSNGAWQWTSEPYGLIYFGTGNPCFYTCWGRGLYLSAPSRNYGPNVHSHWTYSAPSETSFVHNVWLAIPWRDDHNCSAAQYPQPHDYAGYVLNNGTWNGSPQTNVTGYAHSIPGQGRAFVFGLGSGGGINIPCWREVYLGGIAVYLDDQQFPTLDAVSGAPSGWIGDATEFSIDVDSHDEGLGIRNVTLAPAGMPVIQDPIGCTGLYASPCPTTRKSHFELDGKSFDEGEKTVQVSAEDPTTKGSATYQWQSKVDRTPPQVSLGGQLAVLTEEDEGAQQGDEEVEELSLPVYNLKIEAQDGSNASPAQKRSGVEGIEVFLDEAEQPDQTWQQSCPAGSCEMSETYALALNDLGAGEHELRVLVTDQVGEVRERSISFEYVPATGMKDEYVMHYFPLPDGEGDEEAEEHPSRPEFAVNVMNGNLVYRERDVDVEGPGVDLEVERFYDTLLPASENTEWGDGWTLAQSPKLEIEQAEGPESPAQASILEKSASYEGVGLPEEPAEERFDAELQATVSDEPGGGYEVSDESGETDSALLFDETGKVQELRTPGYAKVEYDYEEGALSQIAVEDPASTSLTAAEYQDLLSETALQQPPLHLFSFGTAGAGAGQLDRPADVALDDGGDLIVADRDNDRIERFGPNGERLGSFGESGSEQGQLNQPAAIDIDPEGDIWVADLANHRVQEFSAAGEFLSAFGTAGFGPGELLAPRGVAVGPEGTVWVADPFKVQRFTEAGEFIDRVGTAGSGPGQLSEPRDVTLDTEGNAWIAEAGNDRISVFDAEGEFVRSLGSAGSGPGELDNPSAIEFDAAGNAWVIDDKNGRVQVLDPEGEYLAEFGSGGSEEGQFDFAEATGLALDQNGRVWIADSDNDRVQVWLSADLAIGLSYSTAFGSTGSEPGQLDRPGGVVFDADGDLLVADTENDRIERFSRSGVHLGSFGEGQVESPYGLATDSEGNVWVADLGNGRVAQFTDSGEFISAFEVEDIPLRVAVDAQDHVLVAGFLHPQPRRFDQAGELLGTVGLTEVGRAEGMSVDGEGNLWVADSTKDEVEVFDEAGELIRRFGGSGSGPSRLEQPGAIVLGAGGTVWIADRGNDRIQAFTAQGEYLAEFGAPGSEEGQLNLGGALDPSGLAVDAKGRIWLADPGNDRVQRWLASDSVLSYAYADALGSTGSEPGELEQAADVAIDRAGNVLVADRENDRIERFNVSGEHLGSFGEPGSEDGQLSQPAAVAIDADGDIWVADQGNNRIQEFSEDGEFLGKFGAFGFSEGKLLIPNGVAVDPEGTVWVSDANKVQRFTDAGEFIDRVAPTGSGSGQISQPRDLTLDPEGNAWIAEAGNDRISVFDSQGEFLRLFGDGGSGSGQLKDPVSIDLDTYGSALVAEAGNDRVSVFDAEGEYLNQFGGPGSEEGEFALGERGGVAADSDGRVWVADADNDRVQEWHSSDFEPAAGEGLPAQDDPMVEVEVAGGMVESVEGEQAGQTTYSHDEGMLTAVDGPEGETAYDYDEEERLVKVTLPNGTWGEVAYHQSDGRVKSVTVDPAGEEPAETTYFEYSEEPRRTTVIPSGDPAVTYDIAADGSVLRWWNTESPPDFDDLSGSLYANRETEAPITTGDHNLVVQAHSEEGIASIEIIADGDIVVDEATCEQDPEQEGIECKEVPNEWVTDTGSLAPGILELEAVITDRIGGTASERFWVNIPHTPPPAPGVPAPPTFNEIKEFREEFGLEVVFPVANELELNDRIYDLIGAWYNPQTPEGEVARASTEKWGVPLRAVDVAELEFREWYVEENGPVVQAWGEANYPTTYAGYFVDHPAGGKLRVGVVGGSSGPIEQLAAVPGIRAPERLQPFITEPTHSYSELVSLQLAIAVEDAGSAPLEGLIAGVGIDIAANSVSVGATDVEQVTNGLNSHYGVGAPFAVHFDPEPKVPQTRRFVNRGPLFGGQIIAVESEPGPEPKYRLCTAGFGAREKVGNRPNGKPKYANFLITAGHCFEPGEEVVRLAGGPDGVEDPRPIGTQTNRKWVKYTEGQDQFESDGGAVRLSAPLVATNGVYARNGSIARVKGDRSVQVGEILCLSLGMTNRVKCHALNRPAEINPGWPGVPYSGPFWQLVLPLATIKGDSGSPVWVPRRRKAVAINVGGPVAQMTPLRAPPLPEEGIFPWLTPSREDAPGLLNETFMGKSIHVVAR